MKEIQLTKGFVAKVDDSDYPALSKFSWYAKKGRYTFYAARTDETRKTVRMHRVILPGVEQIDHANGDGLDNQKQNLRVATASQNNANQIKRADNSSGYRGVRWHNTGKKWQAFFQAGCFKHLGMFSDKEEAARAYDAAALKHFGEFARLNFPNQESRGGL